MGKPQVNDQNVITVTEHWWYVFILDAVVCCVKVSRV